MSYGRIKDFYARVALGGLPGVDSIFRPGHLADFDKNNTYPIWGEASLYTFSTSADIDGISTSSAADTGDVAVVGLDADFNQITQFVTLTGQTKALFETPLIRLDSITNESADSFVGRVFVSTSSAILTAGVPGNIAHVRGVVNVGLNVSQMSIYTVPKGKQFLLYKIGIYARKTATDKDVSYQLYLNIKRPNKATQVYPLIPATTAGGPAERESVFPVNLDEKTDVWLTVLNDSADNGSVSSGMIGAVVDTEPGS